jgi:hypothetical protein
VKSISSSHQIKLHSSSLSITKAPKLLHGKAKKRNPQPSIQAPFPQVITTHGIKSSHHAQPVHPFQSTVSFNLQIQTHKCTTAISTITEINPPWRCSAHSPAIN